MSMYETAEKGLMYLFWAQIIALFSFIPFLGGFISLAAGILAIYAFYIFLTWVVYQSKCMINPVLFCAFTR